MCWGGLARGGWWRCLPAADACTLHTGFALGRHRNLLRLALAASKMHPVAGYPGPEMLCSCTFGRIKQILAGKSIH